VAYLLGLTGNIGCGKSTVGRLLAERYGADYVDADQVVHTLYAPGTAETAAIAARFGKHLRQPDGTIDRRRLGDLVMADAEARRDLERLLQPGIRRALEARLARARADVVVLDAIRLIESGLADRCDAVWVVVCDRATQLRRLVDSRGFTPEQAALRVDAQTPQAEKVRRATAIITNDGSLDDLARQVQHAWEALPLPAGSAQRPQSSAP
jgi:dephospho-CoA kinase